MQDCFGRLSAPEAVISPPSFTPLAHHVSLGETFFTPVRPAEFTDTRTRYINSGQAARLGLGDLARDDSGWQKRFARFEPFEGSLNEPLALAYHGHQFGHYNPDIGDGRGFLYAQMRDTSDGDGRLLDFGTKGSGQTPYSRDGDGRLTLKGAVREILATEMLDALGVNTSKTFSVIETGDRLERHDEPSPTRAAVLVRLSHGHIRIGSFQRLAFMGDEAALEKLLRHTAVHYFAHRLDADAPRADLAAEMLAVVAENLAALAASWMAAGFVHGVLNTDNFNVTGESFDYGPWRFLPRLDPAFTAAYFDYQGRYAYGRQPEATLWALCRFAETLMPFAGAGRLEQSLSVFTERVNDAIAVAVCRRLGVETDWPDCNALAENLLKAMRGHDIGFEEVFFDWFGGSAAAKRAGDSPRADIYGAAGFKEARDLLTAAPARDSGVDLGHDYFNAEPCAMLIERVEAIWEPIDRDDDWSALEDALADIHAMSAAYGLRATKPEIRLGGGAGAS